MTLCQQCQQREAVVHLTKIVGETVTTQHLCARCAAEQGIATEPEALQAPMGALLVEMASERAGAAPDALVICPGCGATLDDIRNTGRVGCATCWSTFDLPLRALVRRLNGSVRHVGEMYHAPGDDTEDPTRALRRERERLRSALRQAVALEQFEDAARLRDQLREIGG